MRRQSTGEKPSLQKGAREGGKRGRTRRLGLAGRPKCIPRGSSGLAQAHGFPGVPSVWKAYDLLAPPSIQLQPSGRRCSSQPFNLGAPSLTLGCPMASSRIFSLTLFSSEYNSLFPITSLHHSYPILIQFLPHPDPIPHLLSPLLPGQPL